MKLLLAPLLGQEHPCCSVKAVAKLSSVWLRAHRGVNDAEQQWQLRQGNTAALFVTWTEHPGKVLSREGSFLPQKSLLWWSPVAKNWKIGRDLSVGGQIIKRGPWRSALFCILFTLCYDTCELRLFFNAPHERSTKAGKSEKMEHHSN